MKAVTESTLAAPATRRDILAGLLHDIITSPNAGTRSHTQACATIAQAFAWLDQSDARLAARHSALREKALVMALAQALKVVEQYDLGWAITIASSLTASVAPLSGEPINLVVGTPCVFGAGCVHQGGA
jgi:HD superfamily phosphodiesterase